LILGRGLYENSGCVFFFTWVVSFFFSFFSFYSATAIETGNDPGGSISAKATDLSFVNSFEYLGQELSIEANEIAHPRGIDGNILMVT
jgi:hypothetical protein